MRQVEEEGRLKERQSYSNNATFLGILTRHNGIFHSYLEYNDDPKNINSKDNKMEKEKSKVENISA